MTDTIFALASAQGRAGVAVVRVSGPLSWNAAEALCGSLPEPRRAGVRTVANPATGAMIDEALVLAFEKGSSFTGEALVEFQTHGSVAVVSSLLDALGSMEGVRMAEPGEFTRRAMDAGRLDLAQVEGLADLIDAETDAQRNQALLVMRGGLSAQTESWRNHLLHALALIEATIDFADEDVPVDVVPDVVAELTSVRNELAGQLAGADAAERVRSGFEVAIVGRPNAGKSSLLNRLAGRKAAITSDVAGTTRDVIEVRMDLGGLAVTLLDTAGLRDSEDQIEAIGVALAQERAAAADMRIYLLEPGQDAPDGGVAVDEADLVVRGKSDLGSGDLSSLTGEGIDALIAEVTSRLTFRSQGASLVIRARQRDALVRGSAAVDAALGALEISGADLELVSEDVRAAVTVLDSLVGRVDVEDVLGEIFGRFCIGK
ncbi:tRNA uridine-5-carboxymethylaminomethyl(34) synthesis GTPase MnmE [Pontivivens ytuae]|uniref:tRNA modification GTPase MnmE n=1 Tax=Pontivivens ytuae TaxID=2789856 RepID=A0A7S9LVE4_9RHOB|nr:tRNA uridine-5-carboxymethylaminomethyl(34) synthesis GTPase MnmE [Pontivivens ytuae]QPH55886.1 tRNA uridine-5-carboxymethylaminomethyl(34) synthesis GTPase MnmE [Pontivivens ytuae]